MTPDDPLLHDRPATEAASGEGGPSAGGGAADARHVAVASQPPVDDPASEPDLMLDHDRSSDGRPDADPVPTATPTPAPGLTAPDDVARAHGLYGPEWSRRPQPAARYEGDELGAGLAGGTPGGGLPAGGTPGGGPAAGGTPGGGLPAAGTPGGGLPAAVRASVDA